ncbi:MAG: hypothetical protein QW406_00255 [Ignisphaera sp.]
MESEVMSYTDLKHEILKRLKNEEFHYAVAGLIGLDEVLRRLDTHEEELKNLEMISIGL